MEKIKASMWHDKFTQACSRRGINSPYEVEKTCDDILNCIPDKAKEMYEDAYEAAYRNLDLFLGEADSSDVIMSESYTKFGSLCKLAGIEYIDRALAVRERAIALATHKYDDMFEAACEGFVAALTNVEFNNYVFNKTDKNSKFRELLRSACKTHGIESEEWACRAILRDVNCEFEDQYPGYFTCMSHDGKDAAILSRNWGPGGSFRKDEDAYKTAFDCIDNWSGCSFIPSYRKNVEPNWLKFLIKCAAEGVTNYDQVQQIAKHISGDVKEDELYATANRWFYTCAEAHIRDQSVVQLSTGGLFNRYSKWYTEFKDKCDEIGIANDIAVIDEFCLQIIDMYNKYPNLPNWVHCEGSYEFACKNFERCIESGFLDKIRGKEFTGTEAADWQEACYWLEKRGILGVKAIDAVCDDIWSSLSSGQKAEYDNKYSPVIDQFTELYAKVNFGFGI